MRILSFILVFALTLAAPSISGPVGGSLPGVGTYSYTGSPIIDAPPSLVVAAR